MTTMKKNRLLADHLPSWSKWTEQSQQRLLLLAPSPQAPWEMKPHSCFRTSASWCLYSEEPLSQVWNWELSLALVPVPYASNKWLPLPAGAAAGSPVCRGTLLSRMPGGTLLSRVLILHPRHLQSIQHALLLVPRHWPAAFPPEPVPTGATHKTNAMSLC